MESRLEKDIINMPTRFGTANVYLMGKILHPVDVPKSHFKEVVNPVNPDFLHFELYCMGRLIVQFEYKPNISIPLAF